MCIYRSVIWLQFDMDRKLIVLMNLKAHNKSKISFLVSLVFLFLSSLLGFLTYMRARFFSLAFAFALPSHSVSLSPFFFLLLYSVCSPCAPARSFSFSTVRSLVRSFVRVLERYYDKYLSRRRATLMRKKSKKSIDYLSLSLSV